jgi:hypothetical protein
MQAVPHPQLLPPPPDPQQSQHVYMPAQSAPHSQCTDQQLELDPLQLKDPYVLLVNPLVHSPLLLHFVYGQIGDGPHGPLLS